MVAAGALTTPFVGRVIHKLGPAKITLATAVWDLICMFLFSAMVCTLPASSCRWPP